MSKVSKWYVEYKAYGKQYYKGGIKAKDGKEAIKFIKDRVTIGAHDFKVWHDDDEE